MPGVVGPRSARARLPRRPASRTRRRRYASSLRTARKVEVADDAADITAATITAVSGVLRPRPAVITSSATSSSEPLRKNTNNPSTSAGTNSSARTSSGHTRALSRPNAPAPSAAVSAVRVRLSPPAAWSRKSGSTAARASRVRLETPQTASTLRRAPPRAFHRAVRTPSRPPYSGPPHRPGGHSGQGCHQTGRVS
ncbi:hypothetical protein SAZ_33655 [Streptomyces noursei ZPM]|nr:hypothetical protein SAZ_33655 [Streptomyces noursei ZPM]